MSAARMWRRDLPNLARTLQARYGAETTACLRTNCVHDEPFQTVTLEGNGPVPACVPAEAFTATSGGYSGGYRDEYGTHWYFHRYADGHWHVTRHVNQNGEGPPGGARHWPLKWCEAEVARVIKRLSRRVAPRCVECGGTGFDEDARCDSCGGTGRQQPGGEP